MYTVYLSSLDGVVVGVWEDGDPVLEPGDLTEGRALHLAGQAHLLGLTSEPWAAKQMN
jgi:hypothetical protein